MEGLLQFGFYILLQLGVAMGDIRMENLQYVGCYELSYALSQDYHEHIPAINLGKCVETCNNKDSPRYIGIEASDNFCYCGGDIAEESIKRNTDLCNVVCSDMANKTCGGEWLMSLYDTNDPEPVSDFQDNMSFLIGITTGIRVYNSTKLPDYDVVMITTSRDWAYTVDYHYEKRLVFTNTRGRLLVSSVSNSFGAAKTTPTLVNQLSGCQGFAVDWVIDKIYWVDCSPRKSPSLQMMDLDGKHNELVISLGGEHRSIKRMEVDPYNRMIFWLAESTIESFNLSSKELHSNLSEQGVTVRALALDRSVQRVYYIGAIDQDNPLFSMDYKGNNQFRFFTIPEMQSVFGLGIHGRYLYWVNYAMSTDVIYRSPLELKGGHNAKLIQTINKAVWHMRLVHPDIQKPSVTPCSTKGCSHFCKVQSTTSAVCQCPLHLELSGDKVTCVSRLLPSLVSPEWTSTTYEPPPSIVPTRTPTIRFGNATYIGCFGSGYALSHSLYYKTRFVTLEKCITRCIENGTRLAGVSARDMKCYCGDTLVTESTKLMDSLCSDECPGHADSKLTCGGDWLMSLYDISKMLPNDDVEGAVSFIVGHSHSVKLYNSTIFDSPQVLISIKDESWAYSVDYHYSKNLLFMSTRKALFKTSLMPTDSPTPPATEIMKMSGCEGFAVDWVLDKIFWAGCDNYRVNVNVVGIDGGISTTFWESSEEGEIKRMEVDPYCGVLFWIRDSVVESITTTGENFRTNVSSSNLDVRGITLDIQRQRLFYLGTLDSKSYLFSSDYNGNELKTHFNLPEMRSVYGLGLLRGSIYWINYRGVDVLYKAPVNLNTANTKTLKYFSSTNVVWHMKVIAKELQMHPGSEPCSVVKSASQAQSMSKSNKMVEIVWTVVFVALAGVLLAGVLVFATDMKYWDLLKARMTRMPYSRENDEVQGSTIYDPYEDNVNLI